jgi:dienelactone hydrolase
MKYLFFLIMLAFLGSNLIAQNDQVFNEIVLLTKDNIEISGIMQYPSNVEKAPFPVIILIHQAGSSKQEWKESLIVNKLLDEDFAILMYDIRMHGKSGKDGEYTGLFNDAERSPLDLLAVIQFLEQDENIDNDRIGILGASIGANLACVAVSSEKFNIKSAVSLSAKTEAVQNLSGMKDTICPKNVFYIASENEQDGKRVDWANELFDLTKGKKKIEIAPGDQHGSYILRENEYLDNEIVKWFKSSL